MKRLILAMAAGICIGTVIISPASAHVSTSVSHLWAEHIAPLAKQIFFTKGQLKYGGTINASGNPVHWTKLRGVPGSIADGTDSNSGGDITRVVPGAGLSGGGTTRDVTLDVNFGGNGGASSAARSDHNHNSAYSASGHNHDSVYSKKHAQTVVVAKSGGDYTNPATAIAAITDASESKPYVLYIAPGVYDLGSSSLTIKPYVDVRGAGRNATVLTSTVAAGTWPILTSGTITLADNSRVSSLTVKNTGSSTNNAAIYGKWVETSRVYDVNVVATPASASSGNVFGIYMYGSQGFFDDVDVSAGGSSFQNFGIYNFGSGPRFTNVNSVADTYGGGSINYGLCDYSYSSSRIQGSQMTGNGGGAGYGVWADTSETTIQDSIIVGKNGSGTDWAINSLSTKLTIMNSTVGQDTERAISLGGTGGTAEITGSKLYGLWNITTVYASSGNTAYIANSLQGGGDSGGPGTVKCVGVHDSTFTAVASNCQ